MDSDVSVISVVGDNSVVAVAVIVEDLVFVSLVMVLSVFSVASVVPRK
jgi:hypothetical protein